MKRYTSSKHKIDIERSRYSSTARAKQRQKQRQSSHPSLKAAKDPRHAGKGGGTPYLYFSCQRTRPGTHVRLPLGAKRGQVHADDADLDFVGRVLRGYLVFNDL